MRWLEDHGVKYRFHDLREDGLDAQLLERWSGRTDWQALLNRRSTTWRQLPATDREGMTKSRAFAAIVKQPTLVKRPVLECDELLVVGFKPDAYLAGLPKIGAA